jgi:hypothetical protein
MIRITIHHTVDELMLRVEGCLIGALVGELEACWLDARPLRQGRGLRIDLRSVCHVDDRGRELMGRLYADGAQFDVSGCEMPEVVREIAASRMFIERI